MTITTLSGFCADSTGRMTTSSRTAPARNDAAIEMMMAKPIVRPWSVSHQVKNVAKRAISPWAKLSRPVVR